MAKFKRFSLLVAISINFCLSFQANNPRIIMINKVMPSSASALFDTDLISAFTEAEESSVSGGGRGNGKGKGGGRGGYGGGSSGGDGRIFFSRGPGNSRELFFADGDGDGRYGGDDDIFFSRGPGNSRELFYTN
jgi:hypothetical protein